MSKVRRRWSQPFLRCRLLWISGFGCWKHAWDSTARTPQIKTAASDPPGSSRAERRRNERIEKRTPGGKKGHRGHTLKRVDNPDQIVRHSPSECSGCGKSLAQTPEELTGEQRQVFDIPSIPLRVSEHRIARRVCGCGQVNTGAFPLDVRAPAQYGNNLLSLGVPLERAREILRELCEQAPSEGTLLTAIQRVDAEIDPALEAIAKVLLGAPQLYVDETGVKSMVGSSGCTWPPRPRQHTTEWMPCGELRQQR